ncbi:DUF3108 domain-containing protein [Parabacteroides sp. PF5-6]|uniref:DUF3108 domain-containing protein n=1 Tax=Parabacteroides sp. PF5-6 TaxID=1742403 RepID=UPI002407473C|nr:DUF3108 domain-containing protein [Parabacteroides sp. PF5-6]
MNRLIYVALMLFGLLASDIHAQQHTGTLPFKVGEELTYDMYFRYGLINTKAGVSILKTEETVYADQMAYKFSLCGKSSGAVKAFFSVADTLSSYMGKDLRPLAYTKDAHENSDHTIERATYQYPSTGVVELRGKRIKNGELKFDTLQVSDVPIYDMISVIYYARTYDFASMKKGDKLSIAYFTGRRMENMDIQYRGIETVKANDGREYYCIKLVMILNEKAFENGSEAMTVYISNDQNKVPIRIDSKLKLGSTRIIIKEYKGVG